MKRAKSMSSVLNEWIDACRPRGGVPESALVAGIVVLHQLRQKCPLSKSEAFSKGGELVGARSALPKTLAAYGIPGNFLKEATNRQVGPFAERLFVALDWGKPVATLSPEDRDAVLMEGLNVLSVLAFEWLGRQHLKIACDRRNSPVAWIGAILEQSRDRSGGKVEQHLVGAKLEERFPGVNIANNPGHAGDVQTGRSGDFELGSTVYHVTAAPGRSVIEKCGQNLAAGRHPVLLVPRNAISKAVHVAEDQGLDQRITIVAIEDFVALNIVEMTSGDESQFIGMLRQIVSVYNRRLAEVETDASLKIEIE
jgi:hypothetical protein